MALKLSRTSLTVVEDVTKTVARDLSISCSINL